MVEAECARIVAEAEARWPVSVALRHRVGRLEIGDTAVAIAVAGGSPRRSVRRLPPRHRRGEAPGADLEAGDLRGRNRGLGRSHAERPSPRRYPRDRLPARTMTDRYHRPLRSLRISVTDRCNMRCRYCMPEAEYVWLPRSSILSFEEIDRLAGIFVGLGVTKLRLTGGEPLLRHDLPTLVERLAAHAGVDDLALTTNGILLAREAASLHAGGTRTGDGEPRHAAARADGANSRAAADTPMCSPASTPRSPRDSRPPSSTPSSSEASTTTRSSTSWSSPAGAASRSASSNTWTWAGRRAGAMDQVVSQAEILELGRPALRGRDARCSRAPAAPAERFALEDGTRFGVIASTTAPFCRTCDRGRLTADGTWLLCLYGETGLDLRELLRTGADDRGRSRARSWRSGRRAPIAVPRSGRRWRSGGCSTGSRACAPIPGARCTPGEG